MSEHFLLSPCCDAPINIYLADSDTVRCPECSKSYEIREDIDFAEFSTSSAEHFKWSDDSTHIVRYYFHNMTLDELEGVAERIKILPLQEKRPLLLLPIFKAVHDCLKKRLQQCLIYDRVPNLSAKQKAQIEADLPLPGNNILKLLEILSLAYPVEKGRIDHMKDSQNIKLLLWIRNKEEHLAVSAWPLPSFIHEDRNLLPSDNAGAFGLLDVPLAVQLNNAVIDIFCLLYDLDPTDVNDWQYKRLEDYRIHCTV